jgi:CubicO group peptidase (beta-lactamase class C family)
MFSVQSMSKVFTATAVMKAVQAGLVDLDVPITTYLPDFTVHSAFEQHPERKITLRMLLAHTAGFTHEASVGNNYEVDPGDFASHVASISDTWLRFPVGSGYAYSNLGIDLAGYILERVSGKPFVEVMRDSVLAPIGMGRSTFDRTAIRAEPDRAVGHVQSAEAWLLDVPMTAAGGLYASVADLARFLSFQLGRGVIDGRTVLDPALIDEMRTIPAPHTGAAAGYALGVGRTRWRVGGYQDLFNHGGGGFGFLSDLWFVPTLGLGITVLTNSSDHSLQGELALSVLRDIVHEPGSVYAARLEALPEQGEFFGDDRDYQPPSDLAGLIEAVAMPASADQAARWATYSGDYRVTSWGVFPPTVPASRFAVANGVAWYDAAEDWSVERHRLTEFEPGLFLADNGEVLDFRGPAPTWRNLELIPVAGGPQPWQWAVLVLIAVVAAGWLVGGVLSAIRGRRRGLGKGPGPVRGTAWRGAMAAAATVAAVLALATIGLIAAVPGAVESGFLGWAEFPTVIRLAYHLPLAVALIAALLVALAAIGWARGWWRPATAPRYVSLTVATVLLVGQLAAWRLIGWGLG